MPAKKDPKTTARTVGKLKLKTGEGTDDLVLVLARTTDSQDRVWLKVRLPIRPNGSTGWVQEDALSELQPVDTWLKISTRTYKATVIKRGKRVFSANVGVGQPQWPTPPGRFYIRSRLVPASSSSIYGVFAFGTSAYSDVLTDWPRGGMVGVHGTNEPGLIPGRISHGCVRVRNSNMAKLRELMSLGTPVQIR